MNGIHDLGGMQGFGPVEQETDEPVFHGPTEARTVGIQVAGLGAELYNLDEFRHARERLDPTDYLKLTYYQSWAESIGRLLVEKGVFTQKELDDRATSFADHPTAAPTDPLPGPPRHGQRWARSFDYQRPASSQSCFAAGDAVRTVNTNPPGHTRLPRYARGKQGRIDAVYGTYVYPDSNAHGLGEDPRPLYRVRFEAQELWGPNAETRSSVYLDCWEPYLQPA
jgi:nitrile hydratase beta subunit